MKVKEHCNSSIKEKGVELWLRQIHQHFDIKNVKRILNPPNNKMGLQSLAVLPQQAFFIVRG